jgi:hypothetical protein
MQPKLCCALTAASQLYSSWAECPTCSFKKHFNIILQPMSSSWMWLFPSGLPTKTLYELLPQSATRSVRHIPLDVNRPRNICLVVQHVDISARYFLRSAGRVCLSKIQIFAPRFRNHEKLRIFLLNSLSFPLPYTKLSPQPPVLGYFWPISTSHRRVLYHYLLTKSCTLHCVYQLSHSLPFLHISESIDSTSDSTSLLTPLQIAQVYWLHFREHQSIDTTSDSTSLLTPLQIAPVYWHHFR